MFGLETLERINDLAVATGSQRKGLFQGLHGTDAERKALEEANKLNPLSPDYSPIWGKKRNG